MTDAIQSARQIADRPDVGAIDTAQNVAGLKAVIAGIGIGIGGNDRHALGQQIGHRVDRVRRLGCGTIALNPDSSGTARLRRQAGTPR